MRAVILAGGQGTRLRPYTTLIPKPLVPIGNEYSIIEIIIIQLVNHGFNHITISLNHMAPLLMSFLGSGEKWNIKIDYCMEDTVLSTIGPLTLINDLPNDFLVMNGDILCDLNYKEFFDFHLSNNNKVSVSAYKRQTKIDFGVLKSDEDGVITEFIEKPTYDFDVSMGIYCINKSVVDGLEKNIKYGFDNLMIDGLKGDMKYRVKPFDGFWLDIGRPDDYDYCNENYKEIKEKLKI